MSDKLIRMFFRKYRIYKRLLYAFAFINVGLMAIGLVAAARFFKDGNVQSGEMAFIGLAILVFGILLPFFLIKKLEEKYHQWEMTTKKLISEWLAAWVEAQKNKDPDKPLFQDIGFWLNLAIIGMNAAQAEIQNPYFKFFADIAVLFREAMREENETKHSRRKKS